MGLILRQTKPLLSFFLPRSAFRPRGKQCLGKVKGVIRPVFLRTRMPDAATCDWTTGQDGIAPLQRNRFTALAGTCMVLALGKALQRSSLLTFLGRNGMILLAMNGVFYHFVNKPLAAWALAAFPGDGGSIFLVSSAVTVCSIAASVPVIHGLNRAIPQLVGKPREAGMFFGPLVRG